MQNYYEEFNKEQAPGIYNAVNHNPPPFSNVDNRNFLFQCEHCEKAFSENGHLQDHMRSHNYYQRPNEEHTTRNNTSNKSSSDTILNIENGKLLIQCEHCDKSFTHNCHLEDHMRTHTRERPFQCTVCNKAFIHRSNLYAHKRVHSTERPYKCPQCEQTFTRADTLTNHMRTHSGEKPHECHLCEKAFIRNSDLIKHLRVHTGEKPYKCNECDKAFSDQSHLVCHKRSHSGERPYECGLCTKAFTQSNGLKNHMKVHTGEKPFKCIQCDKAYAHNVDLQKHMNSHVSVWDMKQLVPRRLSRDIPEKLDSSDNLEKSDNGNAVDFSAKSENSNTPDNYDSAKDLIDELGPNTSTHLTGHKT